jgi:esterase/lipase superfamily enzyme
MLTKSTIIKSENLSKDIHVKIYGHFGFAILMFPTQTDDYIENENNGLIESISKKIDNGKCKIFAIPSVNFESWLNYDIPPEIRSRRHYEYDKFITDEIVPLIFQDCSGPVPIITCGASIGAFHAANTYFKHPDIFFGLIAMSGTYNLQHYCGSYFDDNCYFNSPVHYLPNLNDNYWLSFLKSRHHVYLTTGSGLNEFPQNTHHLSNILNEKQIPHTIDVWDNNWHHDFRTWKSMLSNIINQKLFY